MAFSSYASAFRGLGKVLRFENILTSKVRNKSLKNWRSLSISGKPLNMTGDIINNENRNVVRGAAAMEFEKFGQFKEADEKTKSQTFTDEDASCSELLKISHEVKMPGALDPCDEDLSDLAPWSEGSFNFAAYANDSQTIQELAKLGVNLHKLEKSQKAMEILLQRNFDELKPHIRFLHACGVNADNLGAFITKNPYIFEESLDDLVIRIRYLRAHNFQPGMIARIVEKNPLWLMFSTKKIDRRLGHFQQEFHLSGPEVRQLATKQPRLITYNFEKLQEITFAVKEEMGFSREEMKIILLDKPRIFMKSKILFFLKKVTRKTKTIKNV